MLISHLRLVLRDLRRRPTFALTVVLTLAVGIAATTAAFAFVDAVFLRRLPVQDQDRLVTLWARGSAPEDSEFPLPWDTQRLLLLQPNTFAAVAAWHFGEPWPYAARDGNRTLPLERTAVSANFFEVLGVRPELGRLLVPDDDTPGGPDLLVLSDKVWRRDFGADPHVLGRRLAVVGGTYTVIGVAPPEFSFPYTTDVWSPVVRELANRWGASADEWPRFNYGVVARLRPHVTHRAALVGLEAALHSDSLTGRYHATNAWGGMPELPTMGLVERYVDVVLGREVRPAIIVLFSAVGLVLIIACANVASLLLARGIARAPELTVRAALGASAGRLASELFVESLLLGVLGGVLGVGLAVALVRAGVALAPAELPAVATAHMDPRVLAFAAGITVFATLGAGLVPALRSGRVSGERALQTGGRTITTGPVARLSRHILVGAQVALALVVLSAAGLLGSTVVRMERTPLGFDLEHLLFFFPDQTPWAVPKSPNSLPAYMARWRATLNRALQDVPHVPGFSAATTTDELPLQGNPGMTTYVTDDQSSTRVAIDRHARVVDALDDYFGVLRIPVIAGRSLTRDDDSTASPAAVVSQSVADEAWPDASPIGRRVQFPDDTAHRWWTVVGEVADSRYGDILGAPRPTIYLSTRQDIQGFCCWDVVRTTGDPARAVSGLEAALHEADPAFGPSRIEPGPDLLKARLARPRVLAALFAALSGTALLLTAVGLFGVLSAFVRMRRREIAIRSALGATPGQLRSLVLAQTVIVAAGGIAFGVPLAVGSSDLLRTLVTDVRPANAVPVGIVAVIVLLVVAAATYGPMVRAMRVDARVALAVE